MNRGVARVGRRNMNYFYSSPIGSRRRKKVFYKKPKSARVKPSSHKNNGESSEFIRLFGHVASKDLGKQ